MTPDLTALAARARSAGDAQAALDGNAHALLADFAANALAGARTVASTGWDEDGVAGYVALLALRAHAGDRDDLDWATMTHPGSMVWPVVLALAPGDRARAVAAAAAGYEVTAAVAELLGPQASARWHPTAVAGHAGAAAAAGVLLDLDDAALAAAIGLALTVAGGLAVTMARRANATGWHRAGAAVAGLHAARAARGGARVPADLIEAPGGVVDAFGATPRPAAGDLALARTSLRIYPTNGLSQSGVQAAVTLRSRRDDAPAGAVVHVAAAVAAATRSDGSGTPWWDLPRAVAVALLTGDPWQVSSERYATEVQRSGLLDNIEVCVCDLGLGAASVAADGDEVRVDLPPGYRPLEEMELARQKWGTLTGEDVESLADAMLAGDDESVVRLRG